MKVQFSNIPHRGISYTVAEQAWVKRTGLNVADKPRVEIALSLVDDITATLAGSLRTSVSSACSRCGCLLVCAVDATYKYIFRLGSDNSQYEKEFEFSDEDCQTVYLDKPEIDVDEVLHEQLILALPEKLLCSEKCKGLCQNCGAKLNTEKCNCHTDNTNSPFAVLKKLKDKQS